MPVYGRSSAGLFASPTGPTERGACDLPLYQTGTCVADVQRAIEVNAHASGYPHRDVGSSALILTLRSWPTDRQAVVLGASGTAF